MSWGGEKWRLIGAYFLKKFQRNPSHLRFLGYKISFHSRQNALGIVREIFFLGDYAFKTDSTAPRILDAGANIGLATLFFKRYYPKAHITSFEAAPENFKLLEENIERNGLQNVTPIFGVLGKDTSTRTFFYNPERPGGSTGLGSVAESKTRSNFVKTEVPGIKLSTYITEEIDLLKMDIEGGEGDVFQELEESGKLRHIKQMVFEYHANESNTENKLTDILSTLERNNFSTVIYDNEGGYFGKQMRPFPVYHFMIRAYRKEK